MRVLSTASASSSRVRSKAWRNPPLPTTKPSSRHRRVTCSKPWIKRDCRGRRFRRCCARAGFEGVSAGVVTAAAAAGAPSRGACWPSRPSAHFHARVRSSTVTPAARGSSRSDRLPQKHAQRVPPHAVEVTQGSSPLACCAAVDSVASRHRDHPRTHHHRLFS